MNKTIKIQTEIDVITARMEVRELARRAGLNLGDQARISLATSSLAHALGVGGTRLGQITVDCLRDDGRTGVRVVCTGKDGVSHTPTPESLSDTRWMVDEFAVETLPSNTLQVTLIKWLA